MDLTAIVCLIIGVIIVFALIVLLIFRFVRFRGICKKRTLTPTGNAATPTPPQQVHGNTYVTDPNGFFANDELARTATEATTSYVPGKYFHYPQRYPYITTKNAPTSSDPTNDAVKQTLALSAADAGGININGQFNEWPGQDEFVEQPTRVERMLPQMCAAPYTTAPSRIIHETGTPWLYPKLPTNVQFDTFRGPGQLPETAIDLSAVHPVSLGRRKRMKPNVRTRMAAAAHASQLSFFATRARDSFRKRRIGGGVSKRALPTQNSSGDRDHCLTTLDDGYFNVNVAVDDDDPDELESLDNDTFLHSLEQVIFRNPSMQPTDVLSSSSSQGSFIPSFYFFPKIFTTTRDTFRSAKYPSNVICPATSDDLGSLIHGDLGLGPSVASPNSNTFQFSVTDQSSRAHSWRRATPTFQFPQPGPPVAGWDNQFTNRLPASNPSVVDIHPSRAHSEQEPTTSSIMAVAQLPEPIPPPPIPNLPSPTNVPKTAATLQMDLWHSSKRSTLPSTLDQCAPEQLQEQMDELRQRSCELVIEGRFDSDHDRSPSFPNIALSHSDDKIDLK